MEKLSLVLWRERELLDSLLFRLEVEQLVLASGRTKWLARAARDVQEVLEELRHAEVLRAVAADEAAEEVGLESNPSLRALAEATAEPWRTILMDHRDAFLTASREIAEMAETNKHLLTHGYQSAREALLDLGEASDSYGADGTAVVTTVPGPRLVDRSL